MKVNLISHLKTYLSESNTDEWLRSLSSLLGLRLILTDSDGQIVFISHGETNGALSSTVTQSIAIECGENRYGALLFSRLDEKPLSSEQSDALLNLTRHLSTSCDQSYNSNLRQQGRKKEIDALRRENHFLVDLTTRDTDREGYRDSPVLAYVDQLDHLTGFLADGLILVSMMSREFTHLKGAIGNISGETLMDRPLNWEEIANRLFMESLAAAPTDHHLREGLLPELEAVCEMPLDIFAIPIHSGDRVVGILALLRPASLKNTPPPSLAPFKGLANRIGNIFASIHLQSELHGFLFNTVKSLVTAVDAKDPYTRGHSERVHYLAVRLGERLDLSPEALRDLSWSALLHDIGKIGIPVAVLTKPGSLSEEEWQQIHSHPVRGCKVIEPIPQLAGALPGIRYHHERLNGSGYPQGLQGDEIPLQARIIAVADAFDAITSNRAYSRHNECDAALAMLRETTGTHYDPEVMSALEEVVKEEVSSGSLAFEALRPESQIIEDADQSDTAA
jgi:HD-GYP domain-containing protein (c-di-GMP phosphodiesterase class II)